ncbi:ATP-grasp fold amidoligase family protein [Trinickia diaoshuihuensis]|uniref:ATP-grasp fold amidoligase family protein n=1 Tax=Trinickia diaoshuihuensis TaxID=2292265 RepID=UPI001F07580D|nr:ATP-grasp fold amidoligase family protein [Trinickia diaoshuihuensis]
MNEVEATRRLPAGGGRAAARIEPSGAQPCEAGVGAAHSAQQASARPVLYRAVKALARTAKRFLPDYAVVQIQHRRQMGRWANLHAPEQYSAMILRRCLDPDLRWVELTDKLAVREYVRKKIGDAHLIPLIAVPETFTREVFDALPTSFVMKANHGCAFVEVVRDKSTTSFEALNRLAQQWLSTDYYRILRERHYRFIKPRLYFEQLLVDGAGKIPADLKVHVFGGRPEGPRIHTMIIADRFGDARGDIYDEHWRRLDVRFGRYLPGDAPVPRPANWSEIERIATRLAEDFAYVRVDLYSTGDQVYFGELTFTPGAGRMRFVPESHEYFWGRMLKESIDGFERMRRAGRR